MKTRRCLLPVVVAAAVAAVLSCREPSPLGTISLDLVPPDTVVPLSQPHAPVDSLVQTAGLISCSPLPYDSATQVIGPLGGTIQAGVDTLSVPAGALLAPVAITMVTPSDTVNAVRFAPEGLTFQVPASLTMSYANCNLLGVNIPKQIAWTTDALAILDYLKSWDNKNAQLVTGEVNHFSEYAIAW